jgi:hypothetical protein
MTGQQSLDKVPSWPLSSPIGSTSLPPTHKAKNRSANGTSASVGRLGRTMRSNSRDRPGWMRRSLRGAAELPIHAQGRVFLVGARSVSSRPRGAELSKRSR